LEVVEEFLEENAEFELQPARSRVGRRYASGSYLRIIPAPGSLDGFFGARLVKAEI
jgi:16S rRNA C967 or C1407 C5-methylase (RsmB/RsmF family)